VTADPSASAVLALDDLIAHPLYAELAELLRESTPAWQVDQHDAASRDALRWLEIEAPLIGGQVGEYLARDLPDWLRLGLLSTVVRWQTGHGATCLHAPHPDRPQQVYAAAWRPDLVTCPACQHLLILRPGSDEDRRCDCCGRVAAGLEHSDGIHPGRLTFGPVVFGFGTCGDCRYSLDATDTGRAAS
jgi:hypothetical protein